MASDVAIVIQKARMLAFLRRLGQFASAADDADSLMLMGLAVGLRFTFEHPLVAAKMLDELNPPPFEDTLRWVVYGNEELDPDEPVN